MLKIGNWPTENKIEIKSNLNEYKMASILKNKVIAQPVTYQTSKTNAHIIDHLVVVIAIDYYYYYYYCIQFVIQISIFDRTRKSNQVP